MARQAAENPDPLTAADGECGRAKVVRYLGQQLGPVAGYKAGLTNPAVQKRFNHDSPVRGTLFKSMLLADGAEVFSGGLTGNGYPAESGSAAGSRLSVLA